MGSQLLVLAGDVMTGRGVDQILRNPGSPRLHEEYVRDARSYVELAERVNGPVPREADPTWPWGDALETMAAADSSVRVMNLETSVTRSDDLAPDKAVRYRMNPANVECLQVAGVDVWTLANNHVLDHGTAGLLETLETLAGAGLRSAGAGRDLTQAWAPAVVEHGPGRVLVLSVGHASSGVPEDWAAGGAQPGVALLPDLSEATAARVTEAFDRVARAGDLRVVSVHWGSNWGFRVPEAHRRFAHLLVDAGVHVVHGHSSHHPRPVEVYRGRLILYGCGDLVDDYEGITGYEGFRDDLRLLHLARIDHDSGALLGLEMVPFQARRLRLWRAGARDVAWLAQTLGESCERFGTSVGVRDDTLHLGL